VAPLFSRTPLGSIAVTPSSRWNATLLVQAAHEIGERGTEHPLHRPLFRRHHVHLDLACAQRRGSLETDEARADHHRAARALCGRYDGAAIGERAQRVDVWQVGAGHRQPRGLRTGCEQQAVVGQAAACDDHLAPGRIDAGHLG
jgi:hypothetical protein